MFYRLRRKRSGSLGVRRLLVTGLATECIAQGIYPLINPILEPAAGQLVGSFFNLSSALFFKS
ncbi:hypothetical protein DM793_00440 [Paenarthrobacter nitroguajacolicus]|nr:hypothetical protein [Paenarthrobacter nitroguajacolicus]